MRVHASYSVVREASDQHGVTIVWIVDHDGARSVTNNAEAVCAEVNARYPGARIIYRDTCGHWDELVHDRGAFRNFAPVRHMDSALDPGGYPRANNR